MRNTLFVWGLLGIHGYIYTDRKICTVGKNSDRFEWLYVYVKRSMLKIYHGY